MVNQELMKQRGLDAISIRGEDLADIQRLAKLLAASGYFSDARDVAQAAVKVLAGREIGIPPIASMMGVNIIKGKIALGANLIAARIRAHGYEYRLKRIDNTGCEIEYLRDGRSLGVSTFTQEDAKQAGLLNKSNWQTYPRNMYFARAISNGGRWYTPEVFGGSPVYTPEELGAEVDGDGEIIQKRLDYSTGESREEIVARRTREVKAPEEKPASPPAPAPPVQDDVPEGLRMLYNRMTDFKGAFGVLQELKRDIEELTGGNKPYYDILGLHGFTHANEIKKHPKGEIKKMVRELFEYRAKCAEDYEEPAPAQEPSTAKAAPPEPPAAGPDIGDGGTPMEMAGNGPTPDKPSQGTDDDIPDNLGGTWTPPPPEESTQGDLELLRAAQREEAKS